jgi:hypothetical protein
MRTVIKWMMLAGIILHFLCSPVYGGYQVKITRNQLKAKEYISQLQAGANPDSLTRPQLRRDKHSKMKRSRREILKAMDEAEALARAGKHPLIEEPEFVHNGVSEEKHRALQNDK